MPTRRPRPTYLKKPMFLPGLFQRHCCRSVNEQEDLGDPKTWKSRTRLWVNPSRTQFIWLGNRQQLARLDLDVIDADFDLSFPLVSHDLGAMQYQD